MTGGIAGPQVLASCEIFDPATGTWGTVGTMNNPRYRHAIASLPDGRVIVAGGSSSATDGEVGAMSSAEIYDPTSNRWTALPPLHDARWRLVGALLQDGFYVAGGVNGNGPLASAERLDLADLGLEGPSSIGSGCNCRASRRVGTNADRAGCWTVPLAILLVRRRSGRSASRRPRHQDGHAKSASKGD